MDMFVLHVKCLGIVSLIYCELHILWLDVVRICFRDVVHPPLMITTFLLILELCLSNCCEPDKRKVSSIEMLSESNSEND